jgi:tripartite-type tricarboxylate transporter receptor subunit TctC
VVAKWIAAIVVLSSCCGAACAQGFPVKPIRIVVPSIAGSAPDVRVRQIAPKLNEAVGQPVIVENRPGANGAIATQFAAKAPPDGYVVFFGLINNALNDLLHPTSCCRLNQELTPIVHFTLTPLVMVVHPSLPAKTLQQYLQLAKSQPAVLTYASAGPGSITQLLGEWVRWKSGARILEVPYKSVGAELPDLLGGHVMTAYLNPIVVADYVQSGKLRGLAITGGKRLPIIAEVPTTAEAGLAEIQASVWNGFFVPAGTPRPIIDALNREFVRTFDAADVREQVTANGGQIVGGRPEQFAEFIRVESAKWAKVMRDAGVKAE